MEHILLDGTNKKFLKANMHCHSANSDGIYTPEELKKMYKDRGYSILAITDHEKITNYSYLDDEDFITLTSGEYAIKEFPEQSTLVNRRMKVCHLNLYAKEQSNDNSVCYSDVYDHFTKDPEEKERLLNKYGNYNRVYGTDGVNEIIRTANKNGFFVCYNHPRWSLENYSDYSEYEGLWGVEIYNTGCNRSGIYGYEINVLDDFLRDGKYVYASCGDDNHRDWDMFGAFIMINSESLSYENVINALLSGAFYSSTGPEIFKLYVKDFYVYIKCSNAKLIGLSTQGRRAASKRAEDGKCLNEASFQILPEDGYFRIDITDEYGNHACTQAYFVNELF